MNLFEIENNVVTYSPQALMLEPFKKIWENDKSKDKIQANLVMSYVYYMADERSDFMHILNVDERMQAVKEALQEKLSETTSTKLLQSTRLVLQKISEFLDNINLNERDERSNKPIHDIGKITASVEKIPKLIRAINEIEKEVVKEKALKAQSGTKDISMFDLGM